MISLDFQAFAALLLSSAVVSGQRSDNQNDKVRRLRFRRPRPRVVPVSDEEGVQEGSPVPLRAVPAGKRNILWLIWRSPRVSRSIVFLLLTCHSVNRFSIDVRRKPHHRLAAPCTMQGPVVRSLSSFLWLLHSKDGQTNGTVH